MRMFRHSCWDLLSVAVVPFQVGLLLLMCLNYAHLPVWGLVALVPVMFALALQAASANHNHYHTPIFVAHPMNTLARIGFSALGGPKTPYNAGHGLHHGTKESWNQVSWFESVGLRRGLGQQALALGLYPLESLGLKYFVLMMLLKLWPLERVAAFAAAPKDRAYTERILRRVLEPAAYRSTQWELAAWVGLRATMCALDWHFFFFFFVPVQFLIDTLRQSENFLQHWGAADPFDPQRDSVSCYGWMYNALTFNLGYHQEHHFRPGAHWLELRRLRAQLPAERRVVPFSHYLNLPVFFPRFAAELARREASNAARSSLLDAGIEDE